MKASIKNMHLLLCSVLFLLFSCNNEQRNASEEHDNQQDTLVTTAPENDNTTPRGLGLPNWPITPERAAGKLYPFDEGSRNPDFAAFRNQLYMAVQNKDLDFIKGIVAQNIQVSYGAENGADEFFRVWNLTKSPQASPFWLEMQSVLELGGGFQNDSLTLFMAPYLHLVELDDPYQMGAIIGEGVPLRAEPNPEGVVLATLSYDLIEFLPQQNPERSTIDGTTDIWERVRTMDGKEGYVYGQYVRSPIDFRAGFQNIQGAWKLTFFVAGD